MSIVVQYRKEQYLKCLYPVFIHLEVWDIFDEHESFSIGSQLPYSYCMVNIAIIIYDVQPTRSLITGVIYVHTLQ